MKFIIVIRGMIILEQYESIRQDISQQYEAAGYPKPIFACLPGDEPAIEIVWTDAEMELKHLGMIGEQVRVANDKKAGCTCTNETTLSAWYFGPHHRDDCPMYCLEYHSE